MNYYEILGISIEADENEIKSKYRKLAMKYHPDRNPDDKKAEEMFKKVSEAYEILGDKEKRKEYDKKISKTGEEKQNSEKKKAGAGGDARKGAEAFYRNFSANPQDIKNMFEKAFNVDEMKNPDKEKMKAHKESMEKSFENFFRPKKINKKKGKGKCFGE